MNVHEIFSYISCIILATSLVWLTGRFMDKIKKLEDKIERLHMLNDMNDGKLERIDKEKFKEHMNEFTEAQLVGWMSAISYILLMNEANEKLCAKLFEMFNICIDVIIERSDNNESKANEEASKKTDRHTPIR